MDLFRKIDYLLDIGEHAKFLSDVLGAFMGKKPHEEAHVLQKGAYTFFGAGKDDELRVGKFLRELAKDPDKADDVNLFVDFCIWLFKPKSDRVLEALEARFLRNAFFVYIAKASELTQPPRKVGTNTKTTSYSVSEPEAQNKSRKVTEKIVTDVMEADPLDNQGKALIEEIIARIEKLKAELPENQEPSKDETSGEELAFKETQQWLYHGRGIPCRRVGDMGVDELMQKLATGIAAATGWTLEKARLHAPMLREEAHKTVRYAAVLGRRNIRKATGHMENFHDNLKRKNSRGHRGFLVKLMNWF